MLISMPMVMDTATPLINADIDANGHGHGHIIT